MAIKAIALDIDGTLTNDRKVVTPRTKMALLAAQDAGVKLILASGRPVQGLRAIASELALSEHGASSSRSTARMSSTPRPMRSFTTSPSTLTQCASS